MEEIKTGLGSSIKVMEFRNPIFHNGINCTVRLGYKWANLKIGEKIVLRPSADEAIIEKIIVCRFNDLDEGDIIWEHNPDCSTIQGLYSCLCGIYPQMVIEKENSIITVVHFTVCVKETPRIVAINLKDVKSLVWDLDEKKEVKMKEVYKDIGVLGKKISQLMAEVYNIPLKDDENTDHIVFPREWIPIMGLNCTLFDLVTRKEIMEHGFFAFLWGANIFIDWEMPSNIFEVYTHAEKDKGTKYVFHMKPFV